MGRLTVGAWHTESQIKVRSTHRGGQHTRIGLVGAGQALVLSACTALRPGLDRCHAYATHALSDAPLPSRVDRTSSWRPRLNPAVMMLERGRPLRSPAGHNDEDAGREKVPIKSACGMAVDIAVGEGADASGRMSTAATSSSAAVTTSAVSARAACRWAACLEVAL